MNTPSEKAPAISDFLEAMFGRTTKIEADECTTCDATEVSAHLKDPLSRKEYTISGMCQSCQDKTFS